MTDYDYDLFTIGAGSGGVRASRMAAQYGAKVAVAEEYRTGGTCVIRGCVPKKVFVYASEFPEHFHDAGCFGWAGEVSQRFDWPTLKSNKDALIERISRAYVRNLTNAGAELINSRAVVKDPHTVHLVNEGRDVTARYILVATGAWPHLPDDVIGIEHAVTSNEIFEMEQLPKRAVVVGGGYIAVEFAGIFNGLGVDTTLVYRGAEPLRGFDLDVRASVAHGMKEKGVDLRLETQVKCIEKDGDGLVLITDRGREIPTDLVLYATGRRPNTGGLGLEQAGVELARNGAVQVDQYNKSSVDSIYAIGDVTDRVQLTPVALREGIALAETLFNDNPSTMDYTFIPTAVFSQPPVGTVGYTEEEAREAGYQVDIYKTNFRTLKVSFCDREDYMFMKLVVDAKTGRVLGCHIVGHEAGEMIQMAGIAVKMGATKAQFDATVAVHPTAAEEIVTLREKFVPSDEEEDVRMTEGARAPAG